MNAKTRTVKSHETNGGAPRLGLGDPRAPDDRRIDPPRARRGLGRDGRSVGRDPGHRPRAGLPDGPPGAADRARGPRGAGPQPPSREPRARRGRVVGHRRARPGTAPRRTSRPGGRRLPRGRRPLPVVRPGHRRAQGARGRPRSSRCSSRRPGRQRGRRRGEPGRCASSPTLRDWLASFVVFVRLFDRAVGLIPQLEPRELERSLQLLGRVPDATILRLFDLLGGLDDDDVLELVEALSRLSPTAARRATKLMSGVVRTVSR